MGHCLWASGEQTLLSIELRIQFQLNSLWRSFHGIQDFASGIRIWDVASGHPGIKHRLALNCVCSFLGQFITGIGSWDSGFCLWASGKHTVLSERCMQFQVNSLCGSDHGIWDVASGCPGIKHCSALNCVCSFGSIHYKDQLTGFGILPLSIRVAHTARH